MANPKVLNCLWFDHGEARTAAEFYASLFPDSHIGHATAAAADFPSGKADSEVTVEFTVLGIPFVGLNGSSGFTPTHRMRNEFKQERLKPFAQATLSTC